ncbi:hypothetical protein SCHPADRAFT_906549 [Schizopora paradoxa]|uniref:Uncharacterized protein n=1 Tax=Schizopora paradoxa TaxID=27342 RepID=A0A0H2RGW5_9AGAM|nr:hypothetical protein SCHPADRAFT_906549 [Schizopora paradoxa]
MKVAFSALLAFSLIATSVAASVDVNARAGNAVAERDTAGEKFDYESEESSKIDVNHRIPGGDVNFEASSADKVSFDFDEHKRDAEAAEEKTCSLKNKDGQHCEILTCLRGTGRCGLSQSGRCQGSGLTGETSSFACRTCKCTADAV